MKLFAGIYKGKNNDGSFKESNFNYHGIKPSPQDFSDYKLGNILIIILISY